MESSEEKPHEPEWTTVVHRDLGGGEWVGALKADGVTRGFVRVSSISELLSPSESE